MSTDASEFSLEKAEKMIRPFIRDLSLKRISDCLKDSEDEIEGTVCKLKMWPAWTTITYNIDRDARAYPIPMYRHVEKIPTEKTPRKIEYGRLILYFPMGEMIYWLSQKTIFARQHSSDPYYHGTSEIDWFNDKSFDEFLHGREFYKPKVGEDKIAERFWKSIGTLVSESLKTADTRRESLEKITLTCIVENAKARAETIIKESAPIREELAAMEARRHL